MIVESTDDCPAGHTPSLHSSIADLSCWCAGDNSRTKVGIWGVGCARHNDWSQLLATRHREEPNQGHAKPKQDDPLAQLQLGSLGEWLKQSNLGSVSISSLAAASNSLALLD